MADCLRKMARIVPELVQTPGPIKVAPSHKQPNTTHSSSSDTNKFSNGPHFLSLSKSVAKTADIVV